MLYVSGSLSYASVLTGPKSISMPVIADRGTSGIDNHIAALDTVPAIITSTASADDAMIVCPYMRAMGVCAYGDRCAYTHGELCEMCGQLVLHPTDLEQREKHFKVSCAHCRRISTTLVSVCMCQLR